LISINTFFKGAGQNIGVITERALFGISIVRACDIRADTVSVGEDILVLHGTMTVNGQEYTGIMDGGPSNRLRLGAGTQFSFSCSSIVIYLAMLDQ